MPTRFTLGNGLRVTFDQVHNAPAAAFQLWVNVGSADEEPLEIGLAHLHEHMLFKGTAKFGPGEVAQYVEAHGGEINAWTSFDQTVYHVVMAKRYAREGLNVLSDMVRTSLFDADELQREIVVVLEEMKRSDDSPSRRSSRLLYQAAYQKHPYGRPVIGFPTDVKGHTREKMLQFYNRYYCPENIQLIAVGDFDQALLSDWASSALGGDWKRTPSAKKNRPIEPPIPAVRIARSVDTALDCWVNIAFQIPSLTHADAPVLDVLATVLSQTESSRLYQTLRRRLALVNDISAFAFTPRDPGVFAVGYTSKPENAVAALQALVGELKQVKEQPVYEDEVRRAVELLLQQRIHRQETVQGMARGLGYAETSFGGYEHEEEYDRKISTVTVADLQKAAMRYLDFDHAVISALVPDEDKLTEAEILSALNTPAATASMHQNVSAKAIPRPSLPAQRPTSETLIDHTLSNGCRLLIAEDRRVPVVAVRTVWLGGLLLETPSNNGISSLWSRSLARGTRQRSSIEYAQCLDDLGANFGATAGRSTCSFRADFLSKKLEPSLRLMVETLHQPRFDEVDVQQERTYILNDIATRSDRPASCAMELFVKTLYGDHPYALSSLGQAESVAALTVEAVKSHHAYFQIDKKAHLAVVGDVDAKQIIAMFESALAELPPGPEQLLRKDPAPPSSVPGRKTAHHFLPKAQVHVAYGFLGASIRDPSRRALEILAAVLSGQGGRLFRTLRDAQSLAYSVSASSVEGFQAGYFLGYMATSPENTSRAIDGLRQEFERLSETLVTEQELERAQEYLVGLHDVGLQRCGSRATLMAFASASGEPPLNYQHYGDEVMSVTAQDLRTAAQKYLTTAQSVIVTAGSQAPE